MKQYAHIAFSLGFGSLLTVTYNIFHPLGFFLLLILAVLYFAGKANDWLDHEIYFKHERRFLTHSPFSPLLLFIAIMIGSPFSIVTPSLGFFVFISVYLIFLGHIFLDALNCSGVPVFPNKRVRIARIPYDDLMANFFCVILGTTMAFIALSIFLSPLNF
ncbi:MAG: hypothetical protein JW891_08030 [Candidatus Lokiarchaeota archaeon]|nr:hypothetical protein [Candidatus Lokiarchaeota archaeon]